MTEDLREAPRVPIQLTHGCLVVSLQVDLTAAVLQQLQGDLLERIQAQQPRGVIVDVSGLMVFDSHEFQLLRRTMDMAGLMGCVSVLVGIQPGIAAAIAEMDIDCHGLLTARSLEEAVDIIERRAI